MELRDLAGKKIEDFRFITDRIAEGFVTGIEKTVIADCFLRATGQQILICGGADYESAPNTKTWEQLEQGAIDSGIARLIHYIRRADLLVANQLEPEALEELFGTNLKSQA